MRCLYCGSDDVLPINPTEIQCQFCQKKSPLKTSHPQAIPTDKPAPLDFDELFKKVVRLKSEKGQGTGLIIGPYGHVLTNAHVIQNTPILEGIRGRSPALLELEPMSDGRIMDLDLALLSFVDPKHYPSFELAQELPKIGEEVFILGNPKNLGLSVTKATLSNIKDEELQLNATLNPGNSGGPVINAAGKLIGVISYLIEDVNGIAFAVRLETIKAFLDATFEERK